MIYVHHRRLGRLVTIILNDRCANLYAFAADINARVIARTANQFLRLLLKLTAEGTRQRVFSELAHLSVKLNATEFSAKFIVQQEELLPERTISA